MYGLLTFLPQSNFAVSHGWYFLQLLKIAQIAHWQLNQLFQLLHLVHIYGHGVYELSRILMMENVNNDVSKDSPISRINDDTQKIVFFIDTDPVGLGLGKL